jgi:hypothetical protein
MCEFTYPGHGVMGASCPCRCVDLEIWAVPMAAAGAGALLGGLATWFAQQRLDHRKERGLQLKALEANIHRLELRITKLETEVDVLGQTGQRRATRTDQEGAGASEA